MSHSWYDDPNAKIAMLSNLANNFQREKGRFPTFWLDKVCIDQDNIDASLAVLPIFLSGCQQLLILPGPSYPTRLWCVMEIFTFVQMGGKRDNMPVMPLDDDDATLAGLARFDAGKAQCFVAADRQKLLAVIEAAFGTFGPFNAIVREIFKGTIQAAAPKDTSTAAAASDAQFSLRTPVSAMEITVEPMH